MGWFAAVGFHLDFFCEPPFFKQEMHTTSPSHRPPPPCNHAVWSKGSTGGDPQSSDHMFFSLMYFLVFITATRKFCASLKAWKLGWTCLMLKMSCLSPAVWLSHRLSYCAGLSGYGWSIIFQSVSLCFFFHKAQVPIIRLVLCAPC